MPTSSKIFDMSKIEVHSKMFSDELKYYLRKFKMTQKELSLRLNLSVKHINSILNNDVLDISVNVLEGLEYVFHLEPGLLTAIYHVYTNIRASKRKSSLGETVEEQLKAFGINFLIEHPELSLPFGVSVTDEMPIHIKLMMLKKFYGVMNLETYRTYLKERVLADKAKYYNKPNSYIWIRFCELSVDSEQNNVGVFRRTTFTSIIRKVLNIMSAPNTKFLDKIGEIKRYLETKGIILVAKPFIENSGICGITLKKGGRRYIFLSDMRHSESHIFFSLLHEIVHCYFPNFNEDQIDEKVIKEYKTWEKGANTNYKAVYDAIVAIEQCKIFQKQSPNADVSAIWDYVLTKHPYVSFQDEDTESDIE